MILGVAGPCGAGKDTIASLLGRRGFVHVSTSELLRDEMKGSPTVSGKQRIGQSEFADRRRYECGGDYFVKLALGSGGARADAERDEPARMLVMSGIYAASEARCIQEQLGGAMLFVDAPTELRFERMRLRADGLRDELSRAEFEAAEQREIAGVLDIEVNLNRVCARSDFVFVNDGTLQSLEEQVEQMLIEMLESV